LVRDVGRWSLVDGVCMLYAVCLYVYEKWSIWFVLSGQYESQDCPQGEGNVLKVPSALILEPCHGHDSKDSRHRFRIGDPSHRSLVGCVCQPARL
jgi:hypothetical protein